MIIRLYPRELARDYVTVAPIAQGEQIVTEQDPFGTKWVSAIGKIFRRDGLGGITMIRSTSTTASHSLTRYSSGILQVDQVDGITFVSTNDGVTWQQLS